MIWPAGDLAYLACPVRHKSEPNISIWTGRNAQLTDHNAAPSASPSAAVTEAADRELLDLTRGGKLSDFPILFSKPKAPIGAGYDLVS